MFFRYLVIIYFIATEIPGEEEDKKDGDVGSQKWTWILSWVDESAKIKSGWGKGPFYAELSAYKELITGQKEGLDLLDLIGYTRNEASALFCDPGVHELPGWSVWINHILYWSVPHVPLKMPDQVTFSNIDYVEHILFRSWLRKRRNEMREERAKNNKPTDLTD